MEALCVVASHGLSGTAASAAIVSRIQASFAMLSRECTLEVKLNPSIRFSEEGVGENTTRCMYEVVDKTITAALPHVQSRRKVTEGNGR